MKRYKVNFDCLNILYRVSTSMFPEYLSKISSIPVSFEQTFFPSTETGS